MSFISLSVREVIENINATNNGWFLPAVQRPFVWGSRYESEKYICRLFDSILRGYPIGTLIVWNSDQEIPYRLFMDDFMNGDTQKFADKNLWKREDKWLVYDGQQRLQTLFTCLKFVLNDRILTYNVLFDLDNEDEADYTGFAFIDKNHEPDKGVIVIADLFAKNDDYKVKYSKNIINSLPEELIQDKKEKIENIIDRLWDVFVRKDVKTITCFSIDKTWSEDRVNDVFQRLNSGGVPLSGADLLLSKIKEKKYDYEEELQQYSSEVGRLTDGYNIDSNTILQMVNFVVKGTIKIDADRIKESEISEFIDISPDFAESLFDFVKGFLFDIFHINNNSIVPKSRALFPLVMYAYNCFKKGIKYHKIDSSSLIKMKQYFILSQVNDWNTQTIVNNCSNKALNSIDVFPLQDIIDFVKNKNRLTDISVSSIEYCPWFMLKVLTPRRLYIFDKIRRHIPELEHIFPLNPDDRPDDYNVDIIWNMQPVAKSINRFKRNIHPKIYFSNNADVLKNNYDFVPPLSDPLWDNHDAFIKDRKGKMLSFLKSEYDLSAILVQSPNGF
ncbi:MAG: DUF262 domain-containing protein [Deltaproteobacteria bacterium]|jgi:uncharacterized protein with ParB-like and HNH nuclease domain|nr:DUF262 domain-containing protein [Deltaproteobacteria bacterium]